MNIDPFGKEVSKEEFDDVIASYPKAKTYNYSNATVWRSPWMGKMKWIAMEHLNNKFYKMER